MARASSPPVVGYLLHGPLPPPDLDALHDALGRHSPTLEPDLPAGCWLDLRGGQRGVSAAEAGAAILATAGDWGCPGPRLGVAPTPGVARLAALHGPAPLLVLDPGEITSFLAPLPVESMGLSEDLADRLRLVGLGTLGAIAALPRGALGDYLGPEGLALDLLARGADDRPLVPRRPPLKLTARRELDWPLADRAALAALVTRLAAPLVAQLARQGLGATRATLRLRVGERGIRAVVRLPQPLARTAPLVAAVLAEAERALDRAAVDTGDTADSRAAGITAVALTLTAPRALPARQASFFDVPQGQRGWLALGVAEARLRSDGQLGYLRPVDPANKLLALRHALDAQRPVGEREAS